MGMSFSTKCTDRQQKVNTITVALTLMKLKQFGMAN